MIAALWERLSAASSVLPSGVMARSRGHDTWSVRVGGKSGGGGVSPGAGTSITPSRAALPLFARYRNTWITSPSRPGVPSGGWSYSVLDSGVPETYAVLPSGAITMPPFTPGIGIVWTTRPILRALRRRQRLPRLPSRHFFLVSTRTIRMSFLPRPADSVQRKRPFVVSAPPAGKLPIWVVLPAGLRSRPLPRRNLDGAVRPSSLLVTARTTPPVSRAAAIRASPIQRFTARCIPPTWAAGCNFVGMCRNIRTLHNFEPPATEEEIRASALQYVRKVSGSTKASKANEEAFDRAVDEVVEVTSRLLDSLVTTAPPKNREVEAAKLRERAAKRYAAA